MKAVIIDYGMGNLDSVARAFEECGAQVVISSDPESLKDASHIVLPGVGSFAQGSENLENGGWFKAIKNEVLDSNIPLLGICLGMQLLSDKGCEGKEAQGLGLISGEVRKLKTSLPSEKIPHIGWNEVKILRNNKLFAGIPDSSDFYFVHSFHFIPKNSDQAVCSTPYCGAFVSAVAKDNVFGVQFHPEKSQFFGMRLIRNFLSQ